MLETALAIARSSEKQTSAAAPRVAATVVLDPWLLGCSNAVYAREACTLPASVPTLCINTQSLMFPGNAGLIGRAMRRAAEGGSPHSVAWVEAAGTRHQEASDFAPLAYPVLRPTWCACGRR